MGDTSLLTNLAIVVAVALMGGLLARWVGLPPLLGYLLAGVAIGPHTPGFIADEHAVHGVAHLGVALLMFAVGTHFSLGELRAMRRIALVGGGLQILGTILLGFLVGLALGWGAYGSLFLGCALSLSSTAVMMRVLEERGELGTGHGGAMLAVLVVQDLSLVLMVLLLPSLSEVAAHGAGALAEVGGSLVKAVVSVGLTLVLALRGVPYLLDRVVRTGSQELFLLTVVCICLVAAYLSHLAGLSLEIGAFLAGLVISESDYAHEVFSQVRPLRDLFASIFFVSVGMLLDPAFVLRNGLPILCVVLTIVVGKALIAALAVYTAGCHGRTAVLVGLGLAQVGEFSFVLTGLGQERKLIEADISGVVLASALATILLTPFIYGSGAPLYTRLNAQPVLSRLLNRRAGEEHAAPKESPAADVLILGSGRVGRYVSDALRAMEVSHVIVEYDPAAVARMRAVGVPVIYGDATSDVVLAQACPEQARLAVVALPEAGMTVMAVRTLKRLAPQLQVVGRVHRGNDIPPVRAAGADAVIHAEFEAGTEMIRQTLDRIGFPDPTVDRYLEDVRQHRYRQEGV